VFENESVGAAKIHPGILCYSSDSRFHDDETGSANNPLLLVETTGSAPETEETGSANNILTVVVVVEKE
jgi:hypothetical protein